MIKKPYVGLYPGYYCAMSPRCSNFNLKRTSEPTHIAAVTLFWICSAVFALSLFLYGFFPLKVLDGDYADRDGIPSEILNLSSRSHVLHRRQVSRLVFVLIDAFRWDFLNVPEHMPYLHELQKKKQATFLTARCQPPTATMPRIKALMTGSIPNYIDVVLNLGSDKIKEDNLIHQAVKDGLRVVFYGDEVWLNLFPDEFIRKEGTTSFFVSDYTEVDMNVTRHIAGEFGRNDWDILILHYLGLDHIGHLAGPTSDLIPNKLREMDSVIKHLYEHLSSWDSLHPQDPSLLVVAGDHGMHDLGSHGGATLGEVLASLVLIESTPHKRPYALRPEVSQIDLAPTLSVLLGLPIPKSSLGVLVPHALERFSPEQYLFALYYNAHQISKQFLQADKEGQEKDCFRMYLDAQTTHLRWLGNQSDDLESLAEALYMNATKGMSDVLVQTLVKFDIISLLIGCAILIQILSCLHLQSISKIDILETIGKRIVLIFMCGLTLLVCCIVLSEIYETRSSSSSRYIFLLLFSFLIFGLNWWMLLTFFFQGLDVKFGRLSWISTALYVGCFLYAVSLSSSSLIEEEHQTWYFFWTTFMLLILISSKERKSQCQAVSLLLCHRVLRKLNQTGDKWASLPDIADWLEMPQHGIQLTFVFLLGVLGLWLSFRSLKCLHNIIDKIIYSLALTCIFLYRSTKGDIHFPKLLGYSSGVQEINFFWILCGLIFVRSLSRFARHSSVMEVVTALVSIWILASALLLRPCNVILISYTVASSHFLKRILKQSTECCLSHLWLGAVVFFYQGNSNSLSTIDVAAGYVGAEYQNMLSAGLLVFIHTFSFPVLAVLLLWFQTARETDSFTWKQGMITNTRVCFLQSILPLSVYCVLITFQRNHLFIWSVFAPKLLYEAVHCIVSFVLVAFGSILLLLCDNKIHLTLN